MHRFHTPDLTPDATQQSLTGDEASHAVQVLRIRRGEEVQLLTGRGISAQARVLATRRDRVDLEVISRQQTLPLPCPLTLFQAITKPKSMELIVQKATELGASTIQPVISERVVSKLDNDEARRKADKWQRIAIEAMKQSGTPWLPEVAPARPFPQVVKSRAPDSEWFVGALGAGAPWLKHWTAGWHTALPQSLGIWIGPEGDFTESELAMLERAGARPFTMGPHVLRSETAAFWALAVLGYELALARLQQPGR